MRALEASDTTWLLGAVGTVIEKGPLHYANFLKDYSNRGESIVAALAAFYDAEHPK